jgi:hypothetical protein
MHDKEEKKNRTKMHENKYQEVNKPNAWEEYLS